MSNYGQKFFMPNAKLSLEYTTQFDRNIPYEEAGHNMIKAGTAGAAAGARRGIALRGRAGSDLGGATFHERSIGILHQHFTRHRIHYERDRHRLAVNHGIVRDRHHFDRINLTLVIDNRNHHRIAIGIGHVRDRHGILAKNFLIGDLDFVAVHRSTGHTTLRVFIHDKAVFLDRYFKICVIIFY